MSGWIKLHRQLQNCFIWNDKPFAQGQAWVDLLLLANHENVKIPYKGEIITCERGTVNRSITELAERWGWDRKKVRKFLSLLESDNMVSVNATTHRTTITLINYDNFQVEGTTNVTTIPQPFPNHSPTIPQPFPTNKNDKNVKNEKNVKNNKVKAVALLEELLVGRNISEPLADKLHEWICYKCERKEGYQETGLKSLLSQMEKKEQQYGAIALIECIETCMSRQYKGIIDDLINKNKQPTENDYLERWKNA